MSVVGGASSSALAGGSSSLGGHFASSSSHHVEFATQWVRFNPKDKQVFYDEATDLVVFWRRGVFSFVHTKKPGAQEAVIYKCEDPTPVFHACLSSDMQWLCVLRSQSDVELVHLPTNGIVTQKCHQSRGATTIIFGVHMPAADEFFFVTSQGIEYYQLVIERGTPRAKEIKHVKCAVYWYLYSAPIRRVLCAVNASGTTFSQFQVFQQRVLKLARVEIDVRRDLRDGVLFGETDATIATIYQRVHALFINRVTRQLHVYHLNGEDTRFVTDLQIPAQGPSRISVVDNLIVVHNYDTRVSAIYDLAYNKERAIAPPLPIAPFVPDNVGANAVDLGGMRQRGSLAGLPHYSPDWQLQRPNIVIDMRFGFVLFIVPSLQEIADTMHGQPVELISFLLRRRHAMPVIIESLRQLLEEKLPLVTVGRLFDMLNDVYRKRLVEEERAADARGTAAPRKPSASVVAGSAGSGGGGGNSALTDLSSLGYTLGGQSSPAVTAAARAMASSPMPGPGTPPSGSSIPPVQLSVAPAGVGASASTIASAMASTVLMSPDAQGSGSSTPTGGAGPSGQQTLQPPAAAGLGAHAGAVSVSPSTRTSHPRTEDGLVVVDQREMYLNVFAKCEEEGLGLDAKYLLGVLAEYVRSLHERRIPIMHDIFGLIVRLLVRHDRHHQLHQYLQYHVIRDSETVAYQLIALAKEYEPCAQLANDMLRRLGQFDSIVIALLERRQVWSALKLARARNVRSAPLERMLEIANEDAQVPDGSSVADSSTAELRFFNVYEQVAQLYGEWFGKDIEQDPRFAVYVSRVQRFGGGAYPASAPATAGAVATS